MKGKKLGRAAAAPLAAELRALVRSFLAVRRAEALSASTVAGDALHLERFVAWLERERPKLDALVAIDRPSSMTTPSRSRSTNRKTVTVSGHRRGTVTSSRYGSFSAGSSGAAASSPIRLGTCRSPEGPPVASSRRPELEGDRPGPCHPRPRNRHRAPSSSDPGGPLLDRDPKPGAPQPQARRPQLCRRPPHRRRGKRPEGSSRPQSGKEPSSSSSATSTRSGLSTVPPASKSTSSSRVGEIVLEDAARPPPREGRPSGRAPQAAYLPRPPSHVRDPHAPGPSGHPPHPGAARAPDPHGDRRSTRTSRRAT